MGVVHFMSDQLWAGAVITLHGQQLAIWRRSLVSRVRFPGSAKGGTKIRNGVDFVNHDAGFRVRDWTCHHTSFSLKDLSRITGLSLTHLRVWRSRGHLTRDRKKEQFTSREVAEILLRDRLTRGNISPSESHEIGQEGAASLLWYAITSYEVCELWGTRDDIERCKLDFKNSDVAADITGLKHAASHIWIPNGGEARIVTDLAPVLNDSKHETHFNIDFNNVAAHLVEQAERPLFKIDVSADVAGERVRGFA